MSCSKCGSGSCCCKSKTVITKFGKTGGRGRKGPRGAGHSLTVRDAQGIPTIVTGVKEIRFTDASAQVTDLGGGIAKVSLIPAATVWNDIENLPWYVAGSETIRPQYAIEGNRIALRGQLLLPLDAAGLVNVNGLNAYLAVASCALHAASVTVIDNANSNNGTPQGRFMTSDVLNGKNFPASVIPTSRDIVFSDVPCYRRYSDGLKVTVYRSYVDIRIGAANTVFDDVSNNIGSGCIMVFSPFNKEYDGSGNPPLGNDPLGLLISRVTAATEAVDYIGATDNDPFTISGAGSNNPFSCNAHHINELGGFIINLEGLSGYIN